MVGAGQPYVRNVKGRGFGRTAYGEIFLIASLMCEVIVQAYRVLQNVWILNA
jgi:drug/metabolite transporter superfamily protein YnfA